MISIIIPTYNEEGLIQKTLARLNELRSEADFEIIVSDGCSNDKTVELIHGLTKVIRSNKGKGKQLNAGAEHAKGDILFFVHADMYVPNGALKIINGAIHEDGFDGGGFLNIFNIHHNKIKILGRIMHLGLSKKGQAERKIFYGDNGIFVRREIFEQMGGFKEISIMEDYDFSMRMRSQFKVCLIAEPKLVVDARRHIKDGFLKTRLKWMVIKWLYLLGFSPNKLNELYDDIR
ncbi:MAG: TIGR04283 family arsenosugar biosynthesis glycosyltransferase [Chitinophagaceae bacterium]